MIGTGSAAARASLVGVLLGRWHYLRLATMGAARTCAGPACSFGHAPVATCCLFQLSKTCPLRVLSKGGYQYQITARRRALACRYVEQCSLFWKNDFDNISCVLCAGVLTNCLQSTEAGANETWTFSKSLVMIYGFGHDLFLCPCGYFILRTVVPVVERWYRLLTT